MPDDIPAGGPAEVPAAFSTNGNSPAVRTADGIAAIAGMLPQLPQAVGQALAMVLRQVQVQTRQHICAQCLLARIGWEAAHKAHLEAAYKAAGKAFGLEDGDPRAAQLDPGPHLPASLQPGGPFGIPPLTSAITTVGGTDFCSDHVPNRPGAQKLLIATGALSPSAIAGFS